MGGGGECEDILLVRHADGLGAVVHHLRAGTVLRLPGGGVDGGGVGADIAGVLYNRAVELGPVAVMLGALRANGTPGGMVHQYNCNTGALTRLPGVGIDDVLATLRHAAAVNEPGADILAALRGNESGGVFYYNSGTTAQPQELGLAAMRVLVAQPGMDGGRGEGFVVVLPPDADGEMFSGMLLHEPGLAAGRRVKGIVGVLPADGAYAVSPYMTSTIPHLLGRGGGRVEDIHRVLPANDPAAFYYNNNNSGKSEDKTTAMVVAEYVVTSADEAFAGKATGGPAAAAGRNKFAGHVRRGVGLVGIAAASLAVTGLAGGAAATTAAGFGLFTARLCGVSLVGIHVLAA